MRWYNHLHNLRFQIDILEYFGSRKKFLLEFFKAMDSINVLPYYDCNKPPYCIWTDDEKKWLEDYVSKYPSRDSNLIGNKSFCYPVVDILPTLQAVRCFGMSEFAKVNIFDFTNVTDIASFFLNTVDACAYKLPAESKCKNCYQCLTRHCAAGCMGFKSARISEMNELFQKVN